MVDTKRTSRMQVIFEEFYADSTATEKLVVQNHAELEVTIGFEIRWAESAYDDINCMIEDGPREGPTNMDVAVSR